MTGGKQLPSEPAVIAAASKVGNDFFKTSQSKTDTLPPALSLPTLSQEPSLGFLRKAGAVKIPLSPRDTLNMPGQGTAEFGAPIPCFELG